MELVEDPNPPGSVDFLSGAVPPPTPMGPPAPPEVTVPSAAQEPPAPGFSGSRTEVVSSRDPAQGHAPQAEGHGRPTVVLDGVPQPATAAIHLNGKVTNQDISHDDKTGMSTIKFTDDRNQPRTISFKEPLGKDADGKDIHQPLSEITAEMGHDEAKGGPALREYKLHIGMNGKGETSVGLKQVEISAERQNAFLHTPPSQPGAEHPEPAQTPTNAIQSPGVILDGVPKPATAAIHLNGKLTNQDISHDDKTGMSTIKFTDDRNQPRTLSFREPLGKDADGNDVHHPLHRITEEVARHDDKGGPGLKEFKLHVGTNGKGETSVGVRQVEISAERQNAFLHTPPSQPGAAPQQSKIEAPGVVVDGVQRPASMAVNLSGKVTELDRDPKSGVTTIHFDDQRNHPRTLSFKDPIGKDERGEDVRHPLGAMADEMSKKQGYEDMRVAVDGRGNTDFRIAGPTQSHQGHDGPAPARDLQTPDRGLARASAGPDL
jgi:hypothetical protein